MSASRWTSGIAVATAACALIGARGGAALAASPAGPTPREAVQFADLAARQNPAGAQLTVGGLVRWQGAPDPNHGVPAERREVGAALGINPAYAQASL